MSLFDYKYDYRYCPTCEEVTLFIWGKCQPCQELAEQIDEIDDHSPSDVRNCYQPIQEGYLG